MKGEKSLDKFVDFRHCYASVCVIVSLCKSRTRCVCTCFLQALLSTRAHKYFYIHTTFVRFRIVNMLYYVCHVHAIIRNVTIYYPHALSFLYVCKTTQKIAIIHIVYKHVHLQHFGAIYTHTHERRDFTLKNYLRTLLQSLRG